MTVPSPFVHGLALPDYRFRIEFWAVLGCVILFATLVELVRRHRLKERYSILWFVTAGSLLILTLKRAWLESLAQWVGVYYPPTALFLALVFFMLLILIHFSTVISRLLKDKQALSQNLALIETRLRELEQRKDRAGAGSEVLAFRKRRRPSRGGRTSSSGG